MVMPYRVAELSPVRRQEIASSVRAPASSVAMRIFGGRDEMLNERGWLERTASRTVVAYIQVDSARPRVLFRVRVLRLGCGDRGAEKWRGRRSRATRRGDCG